MDRPYEFEEIGRLEKRFAQVDSTIFRILSRKVRKPRRMNHNN
ncbi:MAG: hypothetical protein ACE5PM_00320 [Candidatus Hydrothermarchaeales archaeon]